MPQMRVHAIECEQIICTSGGSLPKANEVEDFTYTDEEWNLNG